MQTNEYELSLKDCKNYYRFCMSLPSFIKKNINLSIKFFLITFVMIVIFCGYSFVYSLSYLMKKGGMTLAQVAAAKFPDFVVYYFGIFTKWTLIYLAMAVLLFVLMKYDFASAYSKRIFRVIKDKGNKKTISLSETGIKILTDKCETNYGWENLKNVYKTDKYIIFFVGEITGSIIPLSAFNSTDAANEFFEEMKKHIEENNNNCNEQNNFDTPNLL